ncbi:MAG: hypothetical protein H7210_12685 [Pyrinomonadaceae bacterium]|nr:hypothetical protein [Phycisphaerales bacterium]
MRFHPVVIGAGSFFLVAANLASAQSVSNYDDLAEGHYGASMSYNGVTYSEINGVAGSFPGGETFDETYPGSNIVIENATLFYNEFPAWGSPTNVLTFGDAFIVGDNLSLGGFSRATMTFDAPVSSISFDMAYYENGPWGGIVFHLDGIRNGEVVASDTITISNLGGRDNVAIDTMSVSGATFDSARIYATWGDGYSAPRLIIDDLTLTPAGTGCAADFNDDTVVNSQDFFDFLTAFFASAPNADFNNDGFINSQDFFDFLAAFFTGC